MCQAAKEAKRPRRDAQPLPSVSVASVPDSAKVWRLKPMTTRQLSDYDLKWLAVRHLGRHAARYVDFIETDFAADTDTNTETTLAPYTAKLVFLLAAAECGPYQH